MSVSTYEWNATNRYGSSISDTALVVVFNVAQTILDSIAVNALCNSTTCNSNTVSNKQVAIASGEVVEINLTIGQVRQQTCRRAHLVTRGDNQLSESARKLLVLGICEPTLCQHLDQLSWFW